MKKHSKDGLSIVHFTIILCLLMLLGGVLILGGKVKTLHKQLNQQSSQSDSPKNEGQQETDILSAEEESEETAVSDSKSSSGEETKTDSTKSRNPDTDQNDLDLYQLKKELTSDLDGYQGTWSVYVSSLDDPDQSFVINDEPMRSASTIKLFIMGAVYEAIKEGDLEESDASSYLTQMITVSDNAAANSLLSLLGNKSYAKGIEKVNDFIEEYGYTNGSVLKNGFENRSTFVGNGVNEITAADCGHFLEDIYNGKAINSYYSEKMLLLLSQQEKRSKIPAQLPEEALVFNKTGEMTGVQNDVAIVMSPNADYVVCILSNDIRSEGTAVTNIQKLSLKIYEFFDDSESGIKDLSDAGVSKSDGKDSETFSSVTDQDSDPEDTPKAVGEKEY